MKALPIIESFMVILNFIVSAELKYFTLILIILGMAPKGVLSKVTRIRVVVQIRVLITLKRRKLMIIRCFDSWEVTRVFTNKSTQTVM